MYNNGRNSVLGPTKAPSVKPAAKTSTPKISKSCNSPVPEMPEQKPAAKANSPSISQSQNKDAEIIKLLNSKTFVKSDSEAIQVTKKYFKSL